MKKTIVLLGISLFIVSFLYWAGKTSEFNDRKFAEKEEIENELAPRPDHPDQAALEELMLRSMIGGTFSYPMNWRFEALREVRQEYRLFAANARLEWIERGPSGIGGRTRAVVVHPKHPQTWWVGSVGGGIWYTEDAGQTWTCQTDNMPALAVCTIAICDSNPQVLYAGTGEGFYNYDAIVGDGIFKTVDGGQTWVQLESTADSYDFRYVNRIVVHPAHADTLLAATKTGVFRSLDGGQSWEKVFDNGKNVQQIICNPQNFNSLLIATWKSGLYRSTDMGTTWQFVSAEMTKPTRVEMAFSPSDTNFVYAAAADTTYGVLGLFKSRDGGKQWIDLGDSLNWLNSQGWYDNAILVHPFDPEIVFVGGIDIYRVSTKNDVAVYQRLTAWYNSNTYDYVHADQHCFAVVPQTDSTFGLVATNDGGVFYSYNGGYSWQARNNGFNVTQFYDADRNPAADQYIGGTQDNGTLLSPRSPQKTSVWEKKVDGDGFDCAWDKDDPDVVYGTLYDSRIYKSISGGDYFGELKSLPESRIFHTPLTMDPHNSAKLFTASDTNKIYVSWDRGNHWLAVPVALGAYRWIRIAVSQKDSNIVWAASSSHYINVSRDGGRHFQTVNNPDPNLNAYLTGIATSPFDSAEALALFGIYGYGKIFRTTDLGQTWQDITNNLPEIPVHCALYMPYDSSQIWIGTDLGVFVSYNNGQSWKYANQNLPAVAVRRLKIVGKQIVAATHGRGVWTVDNDTLITYNLPVEAPLLATLPLPNPNTDTLQIDFTPQGAYDSLKIVINDRPVATFYQINAYHDTTYFYKVQPPQTIKVHVDGYKDNQVYVSETRSLEIYAAVDSLFADFDQGENPFEGDLAVQFDAGFTSRTLDSDHPYQNGKEYYARLKYPVLVSDSTLLRYRDIAVIEPGDEGFYYPYPQMWDYATVQASADGQTWDIVITPYDCRLNAEWEQAFKEKRAPDAQSFVWHDTLLSTIYSPGTKIYLRFLLYADGATNGWGWAIDDVFIGQGTPTAIGASNKPVYTFNLLGNYPNPFNPTTTIAFTLDKATPVSLVIYNALGQKVRQLLANKVMPAGTVHKVRWNGRDDLGRPVASGVYFYRLDSKEKSAMRKMILLK